MGTMSDVNGLLIGKVELKVLFIEVTVELLYCHNINV